MSRPVTWVLSFLLAAVLSPVACAQDDSGPTPTNAADAIRMGRYDDAIRLSRDAMKREPDSSKNVRSLANALAATGKYAEAESAISEFQASHPTDVSLANRLGEIQRERGRLSEAEGSFQRAVSGSAPDSLTAVVNLAILRFDRGEIRPAMVEFDRFIDIYNQRRGQLTPSELEAVAVACRYLGRDNPQLFKDALRAFDEAIAADSLNLDRRVRLAELFLEKFNGTDALETLQRVLEVNPRHAGALLAMARVRHFDESGDPGEFLKRSLEVNPVQPGAHALAAELLIDVERYAEAAAEARRGLMVDSTAPDALIALAAAQYLENDTLEFRATLRRIHERRPASADAEVALANAASRVRLYDDAVDFAQEGVDRDPGASRAFSLLGINALRTGEIERGRKSLARAFELDPYDPWTKNTLDLLDTFKDYDEVASGRFVFMIEKKDVDLLAPYAQQLAEEAYDTLASRYGVRPETPVRVEIYRSHADFSVRTVGLAGLGALGVSFGRVVAMDSPAARPVGEFNWASTLWHELGHVFTLGASDGRVPRWLSEGLSVYEEHRARPSWGDDPNPLFFAAYQAGQIPRVSRLNDGFMRPAFPAQVPLSYLLASQVCEMIETEHGIGAIRQMLDGYRRGLTTEAVFQQVLKVDMKAFDGQFDGWLRKRYEKEFAAVRPGLPVSLGGGRREREGGEQMPITGPFLEALDKGRAALQADRLDEAIEHLTRARDMFPGYAQADGPYPLLAEAFSRQGRKRESAAALEAMTRINESAFQENLDAAAALMELGDREAATEALDRAVWINPFSTEAHARLAEVANLEGDHPRVIRERRAILALGPTDRAEALYQLALAYSNAGDGASARREVLRSLELAPNYAKAQDLLLKLRGTRPPGDE